MVDTSDKALYLVFGGELVTLDSNEFRDLSKLHVVGFYNNYQDAVTAWKGCAQSTVDNAHQRYFVVPLHEAIKQK